MWRWEEGRRDFVQVFPGHGRGGVGWHHIEFVMEAATYEEAVEDIRSKGLVLAGGRIGVESPHLEQAQKDFAGTGARIEDHGTGFFSLYVYASSPHGLDYELHYLPSTDTTYEVPGLHAISLSVPDVEKEREFFEVLGLRHGKALSGQHLHIRYGPIPQIEEIILVRAVSEQGPEFVTIELQASPRVRRSRGRDL